MLQFLYTVSSFFLPIFCPACNKPLQQNTYLCDNCFNTLSDIPIESIEVDFMTSFKESEFINDYFYLFEFDTASHIRHIIHEFKYNHKYKLAEYIGKKLGEKIRLHKKWELDVIIPVPLHYLKKIERGYNQSDMICKGLEKEIGIKRDNKVLKRIKYTDSQTTLSIRNRKRNIRSAFQVKNNSRLKGKSVLLIDDVVTTGTTVLECAKVLYKSGTKEIFLASIARAKPHQKKNII